MGTVIASLLVVAFLGFGGWMWQKNEDTRRELERLREEQQQRDALARKQEENRLAEQAREEDKRRLEAQKRAKEEKDRIAKEEAEQPRVAEAPQPKKREAKAPPKSGQTSVKPHPPQPLTAAAASGARSRRTPHDSPANDRGGKARPEMKAPFRLV